MKIARCLFVIITLFIQLPGYGNDPILWRDCISPEIPDFDCHSPSIAEIKPGVLCALWKGGPGSGKSNIDMPENVGIWLSQCVEGVWSKPTQIVSAPQSVCWNPVLCQHPNGVLYLFYRMGPNPRNVVALLKRSNDGGNTWSEAEILPAGIFGPAKSKPFIDATGKMICGSSVECGEPKDLLKATSCWIEISDASATTWKKYGPIVIPGRQFGAIEPSLFRDQNGNLTLLCRDRAAKIGLQGWVWQAKSFDDGQTWSELTATDLPNPDSSIETVDLGDGCVAAIYNHSHTNRFPLSLAWTCDGGETWIPLLNLDSHSGEMPAAIVTSDGVFHIVYASYPLASSQRIIKHLILDPALLQQLSH